MNPPPSGYEVGYGKPPRYTRFRKGQSGNPKGRPKGAQTLAPLVRRILNEKIVIKENGERRVITKLEAALKQLVNKAASGDARSIREVVQLEAAAAEIEAAEDRSRAVGQHEERAMSDNADPSRLALAILNILQGAKRREPNGSG